jgi:hypothetical protein
LRVSSFRLARFANEQSSAQRVRTTASKVVNLVQVVSLSAEACPSSSGINKGEQKGLDLSVFVRCYKKFLKYNLVASGQ